MQRHNAEFDADLDPALLAAVRAADEQLEDVLGEIAHRVTARWGHGSRDADGAPTARLDLHDTEATVTHEFTRGAITHPRLVRSVLRHLIHEVLAARIRIHRRRLIESLVGDEGE